jgi:hypothetical protein
MKKTTKKLICRHLSFVWLLVILGFLGLQFSSDILPQTKKTNTESQAEWVLAASHSSPTADLSPELKFLQDWFQHDHLSFSLQSSLSILTGIYFHPLQKIELIRLLQSCISINAP